MFFEQKILSFRQQQFDRLTERGPAFRDDGGEFCTLNTEAIFQKPVAETAILVKFCEKILNFLSRGRQIIFRGSRVVQRRQMIGGHLFMSKNAENSSEIARLTTKILTFVYLTRLGR